MKLTSFATLYLLASASYSAEVTNDPRVTIKNGTLVGRYESGYDQDLFLGIPFAQPPVNDLRFANPKPYNETWDEERPAAKLAPACYGYGTSQWGYGLSEDCLYLNVVRPAGQYQKPLPVLFWIFGGAFTQGSGSDLRYNLSFIVERSVEIGEPIIAVNFNYRLSAWGFLSSQEVADSGSSNFALRDQRLALEWVNQNIGAFGGDPGKVTIWGQSAGAASVGRHIFAYDGRNDNLFRSAIMASGGPIADDQEMSSTQDSYEALLRRAGCDSAGDSLQCLRELPTEAMNAAINTTELISWGPKIDGDFVARPAKDQFRSGDLIQIPIISGANTAEASTSSPQGINTTEQFRASLSKAYSEDFKNQILEAYPANNSENCFPNLPLSYVPPAYPYGSQFVRVATFNGDRTVGNRRAVCEKWAELGLTAYCYRFNAVPAWAGPLDGAAHFAEVAFAQLNLEGVGYAPIRTPPFEGLGEEFRDLARLMSSDLIAFASSGDPNKWEGRSSIAQTLGEEVPTWPLYTKASRCGHKPMNFLYDANITSSVEVDNFRGDGIALLLNWREGDDR